MIQHLREKVNILVVSGQAVASPHISSRRSAVSSELGKSRQRQINTITLEKIDAWKRELWYTIIAMK